jgi:hypothetical protein
MIYQIYGMKLTQRNIVNKGYILDGFPKTYKDCCNIFLEIPPKKPESAEEEEQAIDYETLKVKSIFPNKVIVIDGILM